MVGPPPGRIPNAVPITVPRTMAGNDCLRSASVGHMPLTGLGDMSVTCALSRLTMVSASPNKPIDNGTILVSNLVSGNGTYIAAMIVLAVVGLAGLGIAILLPSNPLPAADAHIASPAAAAEALDTAG